ncbi:TPA: zinc finger protein 313-like [Bos taurus]|nr:TPA: zinc finger protein 313-like [Bos taurus]
MAAPLQGRGQSEANLLGHFECLVCLEMSEKPVQLPCERIFCPEFLQECLKPKKPLCALCCNALAPESQRGDGRTATQPMESTKTSCHGFCKHFKKPLGNLTCVP